MILPIEEKRKRILPVSNLRLTPVILLVLQFCCLFDVHSWNQTKTSHLCLVTLPIISTLACLPALI